MNSYILKSKIKYVFVNGYILNTTIKYVIMDSYILNTTIKYVILNLLCATYCNEKYYYELLNAMVKCFTATYWIKF